MLHPSWSSVLLVSALWLRICRAQNDGDANELGLEAVPPNADFLRRATARATKIGDYVYFDGGEISQLVNGRNLSDDRPSNAVNRTLSIDMSKSWKPSDVTIREIRKISPNLNRQAMFTDASSNSFYIWGGHTSWGAAVPKKEVWRFTADGSGGGDWTTHIPANPDTFDELKRPEGGVFCNTPDSAFHFGGIATRSTDVRYSGALPGFVQVNFTTQTWTNHTEGPWSAYSTIYAAAAEYIPTFGPNGLVMLLGGETRELGGSSGNRGYLSFQNLTFMDPATREFRYQRTTGNAPSGRFYHCSVGVEGKNGTYEIFIFGGRNERNNEAYDDVYVLTLPGFHWEKVDYEPESPRSGHACLVVGKRQILSIGGVNHEPGMPGLWQDPDPWPQGLGIFDLTDTKWTNEYDAESDDYDSPQVVKSWYADGGLDAVEWTSTEVATLFGKTNGNVEEGNGSGGQDGNDSDSGSDNSSSAPAGAIAGGVVGGVAAIAIIGLLIWFLRRRSRQRDVAGVSGGSEAGVGGSSPSKASYMPVSPSAMTASELDQTHRVEMHDSSPKPELAGPQQMAVELDGTGVGGQAPGYR
ncbi:hypothetical protein ACHAQH_006410 [Verticillium albo-atrum]